MLAIFVSSYLRILRVTHVKLEQTDSTVAYCCSGVHVGAVEKLEQFTYVVSRVAAVSAPVIQVISTFWVVTEITSSSFKGQVVSTVTVLEDVAVTHLRVVGPTVFAVLPLFIVLVNSTITDKENVVVFSALNVNTVSVLANVDRDSGNSLVVAFLGENVSIEQLD